MSLDLHPLFSLYNFLPCTSPVLAIDSSKLFNEFPQIQPILNSLLEGQGNPKEIFQSLQQFIGQGEEQYGPKKFRRMRDNLFSILLQYSIQKLRQGCPKEIIFALTFYERHCSKYLHCVIIASIGLVYALVSLRSNNNVLTAEKVNSVRSLLKTAKAQSIEQKNNKWLMNIICSLIQGIISLRTRQSITTKDIFSKLIHSLITSIKTSTSFKQHVPQHLANALCVSLYYLFSYYKQQHENQLASYQITKCVEIAEKYVKDSKEFVEWIRQQLTYKRVMRVKLSRVQTKVLGLVGQTQAGNAADNKHNKNNGVKLSAAAIRTQSVHELNDILVFRSKTPNRFNIREQTLKCIRKENEQLALKISKDCKEIIRVEQQQALLLDKYNVSDLKKQLKIMQLQRAQLIKQIHGISEPVLASLKPTKTLNLYLQGFITQVSYNGKQKVYELLYSQTGLKKYTTLIHFFHRLNKRRQRDKIERVRYLSVMHMMQLVRYVKNNVVQYVVKVYQIESGSRVRAKDMIRCQDNDPVGVGCNDQLEVMAEDYQLLLRMPFYYVLHMSDRSRKLVPFQVFLDGLNSGVKQICHRFIYKLKRKRAQSRYKTYQKRYIDVYFQNHHILQTILFISSIKHPQQTCFIIQRIDSRSYKNNSYNFKVLDKMVSIQQYISDRQLQQFVLQKWQQYRLQDQRKIVLLKKLFRKRIAIARISLHKRHTFVTCTYVGNTLLTLCKQRNGSSIFYIENFERQQLIIERNVTDSLSFVNGKLRKDLQRSITCKDMLTSIHKHLKMKDFANRLLERSKAVRLFTDFQTKFKKKLCFCKMSNQYLYKGQLKQGKIMYVLCIHSFSQFPRPYMLRVFTVEAGINVDFSKIIYRKDKISFEQNLADIHLMVNVLSQSSVDIVIPDKDGTKKQRHMKKSSIISSRSLDHSEQLNARQNRGSMCIGRNNMNRISRSNPGMLKIKHKEALKESDIKEIKRWIEKNQLQSQDEMDSPHSSQSSSPLQ